MSEKLEEATPTEKADVLQDLLAMVGDECEAQSHGFKAFIADKIAWFRERVET